MGLSKTLLDNISSEKSVIDVDSSNGVLENLVVIKWTHEGNQCFQIIEFDPWTGVELPASKEWTVREHLLDIGLDSAFEPDFSVYSATSDYQMDTAISEYKMELDSFRKQHINGVCSAILENTINLKGAHECPLLYIPNIRTYAILNKKEYGGWTAMDYCPFCGAKFPERLDENLSEILQNKYGLESWRDYKKAPHEFWTDEWWKKRNIGPDDPGF